LLNFTTGKYLLIALTFYFSALAAAPYENATKVLLVNPSLKNDPFWHKVEIITRQAATNLHLDLSVIHGDGTRFFQLEELEKYFSNNTNPEYVVLINYPGHAKITMDFLNKQRVKIITLEQTLSTQEKRSIGLPGQIYKKWLGEIYFDNKKAGYLLAMDLINSARSANKKAVIAGISGHYGSESTLRNEGLLKAIENNQVDLAQIVHANWSAENAYDKTLKLLRRYPELNVIWCASDHMALAAIKAAKSLGLNVNKDIFIGGFDWTDKAIESISRGELSASVGGHFTMGALAMLAIYDQENNIAHMPFVNQEQGSFSLALINQAKLKRYANLLKQQDFSHINFKKLARLYAEEQNISTINLLKMLNKAKITEQ